MEPLRKIVKELGFVSEKEFHQMVSIVDLTSNEKIKKFNVWKETDGTKEGLLKLDRC